MTLNPGVSVGTMICVIRSLSPPAAWVRHMTIAKFAAWAFEANHLWPLITQSSPSRSARVWIARGSEPGAFGSVMAKQDCIVPATSGSSHFFFCSGVPYLTRIFWFPALGAMTPKMGDEYGLQARISFMKACLRKPIPIPPYSSGR
jgi:hypothetical protein